MLQTKAKKEGQVFLQDITIAKDIIEAAQLDTDDTVVEIGPGKGILTKLIPKKVKRLIAIEKDSRLCFFLKSVMKGCNNFHLINGNALFIPLDTIKSGCKIVSNLPYNISTPLIFTLLEYNNISSMTIMVQREVGERIVSLPGSKKYGKLSVAVQLVKTAKKVLFVPRSAFHPIPKVDSVVIQLTRRTTPRIDSEDMTPFLMFVQKVFCQRRKMIKNNFSSFIKKMPEDIFTQCNIDPHMRPENLSIDDFIRLYRYMKK